MAKHAEVDEPSVTRGSGIGENFQYEDTLDEINKSHLCYCENTDLVKFPLEHPLGNGNSQALISAIDKTRSSQRPSWPKRVLVSRFFQHIGRHTKPIQKSWLIDVNDGKKFEHRIPAICQKNRFTAFFWR